MWPFNKKKDILKAPKIYIPPEERNKVKFDWQPNWTILIIILVLLGGLFYLLLYSPVFKVKIIIIQGREPKPETRQAIESLKGKNIFRLGSHKAEEELKAQEPGIKEVKIYRGLPDAVKVEFAEREKCLVWKSKDKAWLVDYEGVAFREIPQDKINDEKLPIINDNRNLDVKISTKILSSQFALFVKKIAQNFEAKVGVKISSLEIEDSIFELRVKTEPGWYAILATNHSVDGQLDNLKKVIDAKKDQIKEYVDLRVDGRAYYK